MLADYARHLGQAFQIVDDVLDIDGDPAQLGKAVLSDLREGKLTLPVLLALESRPSCASSSSYPSLGQADDSLPEHNGGAVTARAYRQSRHPARPPACRC